MSATSSAIACDLVLMCGGWTPVRASVLAVARQAAFDEATAGLPAGQRPAQTRALGRRAAAARCGLADGAAPMAIAAGAGRGARARARRRLDVEVDGRRRRPDRRRLHRRAAARRATPSASKAFVDFQNDVTAKDIALAVREGFRSIEHVKRYTTTGMATDQGKTSNMNALGIAAAALGKPIPEVGLTTFRQPYTPVTFGTLRRACRAATCSIPSARRRSTTGRRRTARVFEDVGLWKRAHYFPRAGEDMHAAVARECRRRASAAGLFDASTLGKIEVVGPGRGRVPEPHLHQQLDQARRRAAAATG